MKTFNLLDLPLTMNDHIDVVFAMIRKDVWPQPGDFLDLRRGEIASPLCRKVEAAVLKVFPEWQRGTVVRVVVF